MQYSCRWHNQTTRNTMFVHVSLVPIEQQCRDSGTELFAVSCCDLLYTHDAYTTGRVLEYEYCCSFD